MEGHLRQNSTVTNLLNWNVKTTYHSVLQLEKYSMAKRTNDTAVASSNDVVKSVD